MNNQTLAKQIYQDMCSFWNTTRLSYILDMKRVHEIDPEVTVQQVIAEFSKYPLIREVCDTRRDTITIFPK